MASYTTRTAVKQALRIPSGITQHDDYIDALLTTADGLINRYCSVAALTTGTYTEVHDIGPRQDWIALRNRPIQSVAALTDSGNALTEGSDFYVSDGGKDGYLRLLDAVGVFTEGRQKVQVTYTGGYVPASLPPEVARAATQTVAAYFNAEGHLGFSTERTSSYSYTLDADDSGLPPTARGLLSGFRRIFAYGSVGEP